MSDSINLVPQEEIQEQIKTKAVKFSTILSLIFLVIVLIASGFVYFTRSQLQSQIDSVNNDIETMRGKIKGMKDVEINARNLDKKYTELNNIFTSSRKYSLLFQELQMRKPDKISFDNIDVIESKMNISGVADSYLSISDFVGNLVNKNFPSGSPNLKALFTSVSINSVSMEGTANEVKFLIGVDYDPSLLK